MCNKYINNIYKIRAIGQMKCQYIHEIRIRTTFTIFYYIQSRRLQKDFDAANEKLSQEKEDRKNLDLIRSRLEKEKKDLDDQVAKLDQTLKIKVSKLDYSIFALFYNSPDECNVMLWFESNKNHKSIIRLGEGDFDI